MSLKSKRELCETVQPRYLKANKVEKQKILDEFTAATGYHRKHAIRILKNQRQVQNHFKGKTKTYQAVYRGEVTQVLEQLWEIYGRMAATLFTRSYKSTATLPGNRDFQPYQRTALENQFSQHRSLLATGSHSVAARSEDHQAREPAEESHSRPDLHRMGRRTTRIYRK